MHKSMRVLVFTFILFFGIHLSAQSEIELGLYGFYLGQYREVTLNELGQPASSIFLEDSSRVDFFYLNVDSSAHLGFIYLHNSEEIYSIQLTGKSVDADFRGLKLGTNRQEFISVFGRPDDTQDLEFNGDSVSTFFYEDKNYSFIFNADQLSSIKIWDVFEEPDYDNDDFQLPGLKPIVDLLKKNSRPEVLNYLSPNLEIFYCDDVITWKKSIKSELENNGDSPFDFLFNRQYGLITLAQYDSIPAELNLRLIQGLGSLPVYKFQAESLFEEIVFIFQQGQYKIWEIKYKCDD